MTDLLPYGTQLKDSPLLRDLDDHELQIMFEFMDHLCYEAGTVVIEQGADNQGLWLLGDGSCEVIRWNPERQEQQVLAVLGPGTVFGEMSFLQRTAHSASIRSLSQVTVHRLTWDAFAALQANSCPTACKLLQNLIRVLADRLKLMDEWVCELMAESPNTHPAASTPVTTDAKRDEWREFRSKLYTEWNFS